MSGDSAAGAPAPVAAPEPGRVVPPGTALPQAPVAAPSRVPSTPAGAPELVHLVEPEVGPRLLDLLARPEVTVELTIQTDGSVSGVRVLPPVPRQIVAPITAAIEQWRYAPQPAPRQHRVQLVFKGSS